MDTSDPEDSERSVASMGLLVRTLALDGNAVATAAPAAPEAPTAAASAEPMSWAEVEAESDDPGSTCTMTVPSALEEIWLPTRLPSATREEVPASEEPRSAPGVGWERSEGTVGLGLAVRGEEGAGRGGHTYNSSSK